MGEVVVIGPDGTPGVVPAAAVPDVVDAGGSVPMRKEAAKIQRRAELENKFEGTVEGAVAPALAGAARGLTLGGSDVAISGLGEGARKRLLDYQEYDPTGSAVGEIGAIAGAALLGDEAGLGALPNAVGRLTGRLGAGVAERLGGGLAARVGGTALGAGVEGSIYSAGKAASEAALHNEDLTAEKLLAAGGHGFGTGAAIGGALGLAGAGVSRLAGGLGHTAEAEAGEVSSLATREPTSLGDALQKGADVKTIKALGGSAGDLRKLEEGVSGGYRRVAQDIRQDIEATTGKSIGLHNRESLHEYATKRVDELGEQLGGMLKKLDEAGGAPPDASRFIKQARDEILAEHMVHTPAGPVVAPGSEKVVKAVDKYLGQIESATAGRPTTFTEWQGWRKALDKQIYEGTVKASPATDALRQVRGLMEKELEVSGEAAAKNLGTTFVDKYQATKSLYQSVAKAEELTARGVSAELARNSVGLGAMMGAATGLATGGPLASLALGAAGKIIKDRGDQLAADLLSRVANVAGVTKRVAVTDAKVASGVAKLTGAKAAAERSSPKESGFFSTLLKDAGEGGKRAGVAGAAHADFSKRADAIAKLTTNPALVSERVGAMLGQTADASAKVAGAATTKALTGLQYLNSKMPPSRRDQFSLQPQLQKPAPPSDAERAQHDRILEALDDPSIVLHEAANGTLTRDHVEAVKAVYPELYADMQQQVMRSLVESKTELPYDRKIRLGILLDIPTDKTLAPDFVRAIQGTYSASEKAGVEPPPPQLSQLNVASSLETGTQSAVSEGQDR